MAPGSIGWRSLDASQLAAAATPGGELLSVAAESSWRPVAPAVGGPAALNAASRRFTGWAYDSLRGQHLQFAGFSYSGGFIAQSGELWAFDSAGYRLLAPEGTVAARMWTAGAYDARRDRAVFFGGIAASTLMADTWEWDSVAWIPHFPDLAPRRRDAIALRPPSRPAP